MKTFNDLRERQIITNVVDGDMEVMFYDYYGDGNRVMCFSDNNSIWLASQFNPKDWAILKEVVEREK